MGGLLIVLCGSGYLVFRLGVSAGSGGSAGWEEVWQAQSAHQQTAVTEAITQAEENLNTLAVQLGELQAHVIRLDALGERLVRMAELDANEFDFGVRPAVGGPEDPAALEAYTVPDFVNALRALASQLDDRAPKLQALEGMLMNYKLQTDSYPEGRPVLRGWLSSPYGYRTDPLSGRKSFHQGVDFAGRADSDVVAVASGVVVWSGARHGYGNLVEVDHGNGYATRYAHNSELLVKVGDRVKKERRIARMGSSGRSTGPHVHFEVLRRGKPVNPLKFVSK